jgi:pyruvyltransferase
MLDVIRKLRRQPDRHLASPAVERLRYPHVEIFEWRPSRAGLPTGERNFGDHLSRIVSAGVLASRNRVEEEEVSRSRRLFTVGSVLHFTAESDVVWGSGVNGKIAPERHLSHNLDIRAVRGPLTANFLRQRGLEVPSIYGDPARLLPTIFPNRFRRTEERDFVFVPNLHDFPQVHTLDNVISPLWGWNRVVTEILRARLVLSSSLHGLVIADAFGIPARYVRLSSTESPFKYEDYALGVGRPLLEPATSVAQGREMGGDIAPPYDPEPLLAAFPWDLWD